MVSSHSAHGVATGDKYCIEITMNYRYMLSLCATMGVVFGDESEWFALGCQVPDCIIDVQSYSIVATTAKFKRKDAGESCG